MRTAALVLCTLPALAVPAAAQAAGPSLDRGEHAVVRAINHARAGHWLRRLRPEHRLARVADLHSRHMLAGGFFGHGAFAERVRRYADFKRIGEALAMTARCSARRFVSMWMRSAPHRAVVLSRRFARVGIGRRVGRLGGSYACLVTADFASRR